MGKLPKRCDNNRNGRIRNPLSFSFGERQDTRNKSNNELKDETNKLINDTIIYVDKDYYNYHNNKNKTLNIEFNTNDTVTEICKDKNIHTAALSFADAATPGGSVLYGAKTQEECLCRCSNLYESIISEKCDKEFYSKNLSNYHNTNNTKNNCFKFSPIFDSGNCLWNGKMTKFIDINDDSLMARPICNKNTFGNWNEQKQYITGYINITSNDLIESIYKYIELTYKYSELKIDRISLIANGVLKRAYNLQQLLLSKNIYINDKNMINENDFKKLQNISINSKIHIILDDNSNIINEIIKENKNKDKE